MFIRNSLYSAFFFAAKKLLEYILSDAARKVKGLENITNEDQAVELCHALLNNSPPLVVPSSKSSGSSFPGMLWCPLTCYFFLRRLFALCERVTNTATGQHEKIGGTHVIRAIPHRGSATQLFNREVSSCPVLSRGRGLFSQPCLPPPQGRYFWIYQGNESWNTIKLGLIALAIVACCCYQVGALCGCFAY